MFTYMCILVLKGFFESNDDINVSFVVQIYLNCQMKVNGWTKEQQATLISYMSDNLLMLISLTYIMCG